MKRTIALCDSDREYADRIAEYARNGDFRKEVEITVCTRPELFADWRRDGRFDVYVAAIELAPAIAGSSGASRPIVWIGEPGAGLGPDGARISNKYEAVPKLLRCWLDRAAAHPNAVVTKRAAIVGVWSAAGGVGKTRLTGYLADAWTKKGVRTFVAGFDPGATGGAEGETAIYRDASDWLYAIKSGRPIEESRRATDEAALWHGFSSGCSYREWAGIGRREGEALLEAAAADIGDGIVLADAGTGWSAWAEVVWDRSDEILCVVTEERSCLAKTDKWLNDWPEWEVSGAYRAKTRFVVNRCLNGEAPLGSLDRGRQAFRLPYVPEWKQHAERNDPVFQREATRLAEEVRAACAAAR